MPNGNQPSDPYAEFGGTAQTAPAVAQPAPAATTGDPYSEFGGRATLPAGAPPPPQRGILENIVGGLEKGASETVQGGLNILGRGVEMATGAPKGSLQAGREETEAPSTARDIGEMGENIAEFAGGDAALEGLAKMAKIAHVAPEVLELAERYPKIAKMLTSVGKGAAVGGVQGAVKGAAEGKAEEGAIGGAVGGAVGAGVAETASEVAGALGKRLGIGTTAAEDITRGAKPGKRNYRFAEDFQTAAPYMDAEHQISPNKSLEDWADATATARKKVWTDQVQPLVARHTTEPLGGLQIRNSMSSQIPDTMKRFSPEEAAKVERLANQFMPGQVFALQVGDAEGALEHFNAKLAETGYWSKLPSERAAMLRTNGDVLGYKAAADAIRDELYNKLNVLEPGSNIAAKKKAYGALRNVENEIRGQVTVQGRQSPMSLKESIGLITGLGAGGLGGAAAAAIPFIDRAVNAPEALVGRAVQKAARPGEEGLVSRAAQAVGRGAKAVAPAAGAAMGEAVGEAMPEDRITFTASDGSTHSIPASQLKAAMAIDPKLVITNQ